MLRTLRWSIDQRVLFLGFTLGGWIFWGWTKFEAYRVCIPPSVKWANLETAWAGPMVDCSNITSNTVMPVFALIVLTIFTFGLYLLSGEKKPLVLARFFSTMKQWILRNRKILLGLCIGSWFIWIWAVLPDFVLCIPQEEHTQIRNTGGLVETLASARMHRSFAACVRSLGGTDHIDPFVPIPFLGSLTLLTLISWVAKEKTS